MHADHVLSSRKGQPPDHRGETPITPSVSERIRNNIAANGRLGWFSAGPLLGARAAKADIRLGADLAPGGMDPAWMLRSLVDRSPLVWMAEVNGLLVDLRDMPREVQEIAFAKGMIPYIPADQE